MNPPTTRHECLQWAVDDTFAFCMMGVAALSFAFVSVAVVYILWQVTGIPLFVVGVVLFWLLNMGYLFFRYRLYSREYING